MIRVGLIMLGLLCAAETSEACNRCGLFGNRCRYYKPNYSYSYVKPVAVVQSPDVFVVQNNYPQPIAQQGQTVFGYQSYAAAYSVNPGEVLRQAAALSQAASATASIGISGFHQTAQTQLALQAQITEPLARGHAAAQVLSAAGLSQRSEQQQQSLSLRIYQEGGQWKVQQADSAQVNARVETRIGGEEVIPPAPTTSILAMKCAKCHGVNLTEPKGSLYIDAGHKLDCNVVLKSIQLIKTDKMPKPPEPGLTAPEKAAVLDELLSLAKELDP